MAGITLSGLQTAGGQESDHSPVFLKSGLGPGPPDQNNLDGCIKVADSAAPALMSQSRWGC